MKTKIVLKFFIFIAVLVCCIYCVERFLIPKFFYNETWSTTTTYTDFYDLEPDSVDVLFLGSSHGITFFNPQILYDDYQITSFNLCSVEQSTLVSYYWLKEACKTQKPKVVVLDTFTLFKYGDKYKYNAVNCSESALRRAVDNMRLSKNKLEVVKEICQLDDTQDALSYFLPNIRYHSRWNEFSENDFDEIDMKLHGGVKGYSMLMKLENNPEYVPFEAENSEGSWEMVDSISGYLDQIVEFCNDNEISLILTCVPMSEEVEKYNTVKEYVSNHGLDYYDFNEKSVCEDAGYDYTKNSSGHGDFESASIVTKYIGEILKDKYGLVSISDDSFNVSRVRYNEVLKNYNLINEDNVYEYLEQVKDGKYTLFVFARNNYREAYDVGVINAMYALGLDENLNEVETGYYYAVKDGVNKREEIMLGDFSISGSIREGKEYYAISTTKYADSSHDDVININGVENNVGRPGVSIVVYDNDTKKTIDKVNISNVDGQIVLVHY